MSRASLRRQGQDGFGAENSSTKKRRKFCWALGHEKTKGWVRWKGGYDWSVTTVSFSTWFAYVLPDKM